MSYIVRLNKEAEEKIAGWGLSKRLVDEVRFRMTEDLAEHHREHAHTARRGDRDMLEYSFTTDGGTPGTTYLFLFWLLHSQDEEALIIVDCDYLAVTE